VDRARAAEIPVLFDSDASLYEPDVIGRSLDRLGDHGRAGLLAWRRDGPRETGGGRPCG